MVLPLSGHDLGVGAGDVDTGIQAGLVVSLDDVTAEDLASTNTAVVWALGSRETALGPAIWPAVDVEKSVFLLETEPELVSGVLLEQEIGVVTEVVCVWLAVRSPGLAHHDDVVTQAEGVLVESDGAEVDIRVVSWGLASR